MVRTYKNDSISKSPSILMKTAKPFVTIVTKREPEGNGSQHGYSALLVTEPCSGREKKEGSNERKRTGKQETPKKANPCGIRDKLPLERK